MRQRSAVAVLARLTARMLAQYPLELWRTDALQVLVARSSVLAQEHLLVTNVRVTALLPVVSWQTVVTFGPRGPVFTLTETCAITPVMNRAHLVAVTLDADVLIIQFGRGVAVESQSAVLAVLAPGVVLAADACDDVQVVDVAAAIGVAVALAV